MATHNNQVAASADDAFEGATGTMNLTAANVGAITTHNQWAGLRFTNVTVPQGAAIESATLAMNCSTAANDDPVFDMYGEKAANAGTFTTGSGNISGRTRTTAKTAVSAIGVGTGFYSVDVKGVVQEIVDQGGWASGNAMAFILDALAGIAWQFVSYDGTPANAATLSITWSTGAGSKVAGVRLTTRVGGLLTL